MIIIAVKLRMSCAEKKRKKANSNGEPRATSQRIRSGPEPENLLCLQRANTYESRLIMIDDRDVEYDLKYFNSEIKDRNCQPCRCLTIPWWINQPAKVSDLAWIFRQASSAIYQTPRLVQVPLKFGYCVFIYF